MYTTYDWAFGDHWGLKAGLRGICFRNPENGTSPGLWPDISLSYNGFHAGKVVASYGWNQQNLFYTGLSSSGLPAEFWLIAGRAPVVIVTTTVPVSEEKKDMSSLKENIVRWATVSVTDGENEVFLTGRRDDDYFPPYVYSTSMLSGEIGKRYRLKVRYSGLEVEAETVIPPAHELKYIDTEQTKNGSYMLRAGLNDRPETKDYYKFFIRVDGRDSVYKSSLLGLVDDAVLDNGVNDIQIFNSFGPSSVPRDSSMYFKVGDKVWVKLCTMSEDVYNYWSDFDDVASLSLNPFFPVTKKIRSNIKGGLGYWAGYGSTYYSVECK